MTSSPKAKDTENAVTNTFKKRRPRASKACLECRRRKVRCDVLAHGSPCSNCALDEEMCIIAARASKRYYHGSSLVPPGSSATWLKRKFYRTTNKKPRLQMNPSQLSESQGSRPSHEPEKHEASAATDTVTVTRIDADTHILTGSANDLEDTSVLSLPGINEGFTALRESKVSTGGASSSSSAPRAEPGQITRSLCSVFQQREHMFTTTVPISAYRFLGVGNLHKLPPEDINYLELKHCLRVPCRVFLDEFVQQYFRYVHPFLPLINEASFHKIYDGSDEQDQANTAGTFSVLVLQAMLFTACSFMSPKTLRRLGFSSVKAARRTMFERARLLYTFEVETSRLHVAQASLLLSYWTPASEDVSSRPNAAWLRIAIEKAKQLRAHQAVFEPSNLVEPADKHFNNSLKRLWACCIVRDGTMAISSRRRCQLTPGELEQSTAFSLRFEDLQDEIRRSKVYVPQVKMRLLEIFLDLGELCVQIAQMSTLLFPYDTNQSVVNRMSNPVKETASLISCQTDLERWHARTAGNHNNHWHDGRPCADQPMDDHPSLGLFQNLQRIYYYSAKIAVANRQILLHYEASTAHTRDLVTLRALLYTLSTAKNGRENPCTLPSSEENIFLEAMKIYQNLYEGVEGLTEVISSIVNQKQFIREPDLGLSLSSRRMKTQIRENQLPIEDYAKLALTIDLTLSTGYTTCEGELSKTIRWVMKHTVGRSPTTASFEQSPLESAMLKLLETSNGHHLDQLGEVNEAPSSNYQQSTSSSDLDPSSTCSLDDSVILQNNVIAGVEGFHDNDLEVLDAAFSDLQNLECSEFIDPNDTIFNYHSLGFN
ncbi:unnamed protein product [Clonostachys rhizophaga]|uniref:Zn(2)-C6 fungal-type domain-containing protein n=1 Tax=Clonostachys rhizophaga TaxID=160324 RepID=A0A9N9VX87_9HYPO|nr:unnamed protein product [Clonostachys rhizophaga]